MSKISKTEKRKRPIAFMLIAVLLMSALFMPIQSMASDENKADTAKVIYKINDSKSDDLELNVVLDDDGKSGLTKDMVPDNPQDQSDQTFVGWNNINADTQKAKDKLWSKEDLIKNFIISEDTKFKAIYEDKPETSDDASHEDQEKSDEPESKEENKEKVTKPIKRNGNISTQSSGDYSMEMKWASSGTSESSIDANSSDVLKITVKSAGGTPANNDHQLKMSYENLDPVNGDTSVGFDLTEYTGGPTEPIGNSHDLDGIVSDVAIDTNAKTITYTFTSETFALAQFNLTFKATGSQIYNKEKLGVNAQFFKDGSAETDLHKANATANITEGKIQIRNRLMDPAELGTGKDVITFVQDFYQTTFWSQSGPGAQGVGLKGYQGNVDFAKVNITAKGATKTYAEWLQEAKDNNTSPVAVIQYVQGGVAKDLEVGTTGLPTVLEYNANSLLFGKSTTIQITTSEEFVEGSGIMPKINFTGNGVTGGVTVNLKAKFNGRGPWQSLVQAVSPSSPPANQLEIASAGVYEAKDGKLNMIVRKAVAHNVPYLQPDSLSLKDDPKYGYMYKHNLFGFEVTTPRSKTTAQGKVDKITFNVPTGVYVTDIRTPRLYDNYTNYESISIGGVKYDPGEIITFPTGQTGSIEIEINGLQYMKQANASPNSLSDICRIRFIGYTNGLSAGSSVKFEAVENSSNKASESGGVIDEKGYYIDPFNHAVSNTIYVKENNSYNAVSSVNKGSTLYMRAVASGSDYPYGSNIYFNANKESTYGYQNPVVYMSLPPGFEVAGEPITDSVGGRIYDSGNSNGFKSSQIKLTKKEFENAGIWKDQGGTLVEIKFTDMSGNDIALGANKGLYLPIKVSETYDTSILGDAVTFTDDSNVWNSWGNNAKGAVSNSNPRSAFKLDLPAGAAGKANNSIRSSSPRSHKINITDSAGAKASGYVRTGANKYMAYVDGNSDTLPKRPAGSKNEEFKFYMNYNVDETVSDARAYFMLPKNDQGTGWRTALNKQPSVSTNIPSGDYSVWYTTDSDILGKNMDATGSITANWTEMTGNIPANDLNKVTGFMYKYNELKKGDNFTMLMPFELPKVSSGVAYDSIAKGDTQYWFDSLKGQGGLPAVQLIKSEKPLVREKIQNGDGPIVSDNQDITYGTANADLPKWYEVITYDDQTEKIKIDQVVLEYKEQGQSNVETTTFSSFKTPQDYTPAQDPILGTTHAIGYKTEIDFGGTSATDYFNGMKPGIYRIKYLSSEDDDTQVGTAERNITITKTAANSIVTTQGSIEYFFDQTPAQISTGAVSWDKIYRNNLNLTDSGSKIDANVSSNDVKLQAIYMSNDLNTSIGTGTDAMKRVADVPGSYVLKYEYKDKYDNKASVYLSVFNKYRGDLTGKVLLDDGTNSPVQNATLSAISKSDKPTGSNGTAVFNYETTKGALVSSNYELGLSKLPAGYKMPTTTTKSGIMNVLNNDGTNTKLVETFNVSPVAIKAIFDGNQSENYMKSVTLYKKPTSGPDQLIKTENITSQGSFTFYPASGQVFDGDYYIKVELKDGYETTTGSEFAKSSGIIKTGDLTVLNDDITKTLKIKKSSYKVNYYTIDDQTNPVTTYAVTYKDDVVNGSRPIPQTTTKSDSHFVGWYDAKTGGNKIDPATMTMGAVNLNIYERHEINKYDVVFRAGSNGSLDGSGTKIITVGGITHGATWTDALSGKVPQPKASANYYFDKWSPDLPRGTSPITKSAVYTANFKQKIDLTFTADDAQAVKYDGNKHTPKVNVKQTSGTLLTGHKFEKTEASSSGTNAGTYKSTFNSVNISGLGGKSVNYYYNVTMVSGTFKINKRSITITPKDVSKTYDGKTLNASSFSLSGDGLASGQKIGNLNFTGSRKNAGTNDTGISGTVKITNNNGNGSYESNYTVSKNKGNIKIDKRDITVAPVSASKVYDGNALTATNIKIVKGSMASGEKLVDPKFSGTQTEVGTKNIIVTDIGVQGGSKSNYTISSDTGTLEVTRRNDPIQPSVTPPVNPPTDVDPTPDHDGNQSQTRVSGGNDLPEDTVQINAPQAAKDQGIPTFGIGDNEIPLYGVNGYDTWALVNLILTIITATLAALIAIMGLFRRKDEETLADDYGDQYEKETKRRSLLWMITGIAAAVVGIVIFILTQDMSNSMVLLDWWTLAHSILLIACIFTSIMAFRKKDDEYGIEEY